MVELLVVPKIDGFVVGELVVVPNIFVPGVVKPEGAPGTLHPPKEDTPEGCCGC